MKKTLFLIIFIFIFTSNRILSQVYDNISDKEKLAQAYNQVGFDLFHLCNQQLDVDSNLLISPFSISMAMAMAYNGANGNTKSEMQEVLHLQNFSDEMLNKSASTLKTALLNFEEDTIAIANSLWHRDDVQLVDDYVNLCTDFYHAETNALDFSRSDAKDIINQWVYDNTNEKITNLIEEVSPQHVLFIVNAMYFKGTWKKIFDEQATTNQPFYLKSGQTINVPTMVQMDTFRIISNNKFKAVELPYSDGTNSMVFMLPSENYDIDDLISECNQTNWLQWQQDYYESPVQLYLPKFRFGYTNDLVDEFSDLGMHAAFGFGADFSKLYAPGGIFISKINHKTFVEVNEKGSEAAAATSVEFKWGNNPGLFKANRPFLFLITNNKTNSILFLGKVAKPLLVDLKSNDSGEITSNQISPEQTYPYQVIYNAAEKKIYLSKLGKFQNTDTQNPLRIDLISISGKIMETWYEQNLAKQQTIALSVSHLQSNIYLLRIAGESFVYVNKLNVY